MDWLNLHIPSVLRSPAFVGSSPAERGTWVCVLGYACEIECAGRLVGAATWKDRQWQQACGVTLREVRAAWKLLAVEGEDVVVNGYPIAREKQVREGRRQATAGSLARWGKTPTNGTTVGGDKGEGKGGGKGSGKGGALADAEGEGEGEGEGEEGSPPPRASQETPEEASARSLGTWINWHSKDRARERENVVEVANLVARYTPRVVQAAAERIAHREHRKAWPNELLAEITAHKPATASTTPTAKDRATALVSKHGWERIRSVIGVAVLKDAVDVVECLVCEASCMKRVLDELGEA